MHRGRLDAAFIEQGVELRDEGYTRKYIDFRISLPEYLGVVGILEEKVFCRARNKGLLLDGKVVNKTNRYFQLTPRQVIKISDYLNFILSNSRYWYMNGDLERIYFLLVLREIEPKKYHDFIYNRQRVEGGWFDEICKVYEAHDEHRLIQSLTEPRKERDADNVYALYEYIELIK